MEINLFFESGITLENRSKLKLFLTSLFKREKKPLESLVYVFCSDDYLLGINRQYLDHDFYTDIISFDLGESKRSPVVGEIYISTDRVRENAKSNNASLKKELHRVIFHGALHLCGYKDKSEKEKEQMRKKEDEYLMLYGLQG